MKVVLLLSLPLLLSMDMVAAPRASASLPVQEIIQLLRHDPGLLLALKHDVLANAEQQGRIVEASELSDQTVFRMVSDDPAIAGMATQEILKRGYFKTGAANFHENRAGQGRTMSSERTASSTPATLQETDTPTAAAPVLDERTLTEGMAQLQASNRGSLPADFSGSAESALSAIPQMSADPDTGQGFAQTESSGTKEENKAPEQVVTPVASPVFQSKRHPYPNVPALDDLYSQAIDSNAVLDRFGASVFRNGTGNSSDLPMDLPVGPDYVVGPGDGLKVELWGGISERLQRVVDHEGRVALPEVGTVQVSGRNLGEVQALIQHALRSQFRDIRADISLSRLRTVRVYVVGDVLRPGAYDISALSTPLNALYAAGGPTPQGSIRTLRHYRGQQLVQEVDVYDLILHGVRSGLERLEPGDTILVPPMGSEVTVQGMVRRPATYELRGAQSLAETLEMAGSVLATGTLRHIDVERIQAHESRVMLSLDLPENGSAHEVEKKLREFAVQDGDKIKISPIFPYSNKTVYVTGHVFKPGKYPWRDGLRVHDVIASYADLLPEPYKHHAEIVRLDAPDYHPRMVDFDLSAALDGAPEANLTLQPFDTIRIYGRYEFEDAPAIDVTGEVRDPGPHEMSGETRLKDAIFLAGGLTPDALLDDVHVFRHTQDSRILVLSADLRKVLAGDEVNNILLMPRDQVIVHRNSAKIDPPVVYIRGEVANPGRYPLGEGVTASQLVRLAGGLRRGAYTETADLARFTAQTGSASVRSESRKVNIGAALSGDSTADVLLRDGDVLSIRQISGWEDLGASVTVKGEVAHPGTYGISPGEHLSSVLRRAGGFYQGAYPAAAILRRRQVKELAEKSKAELIQRLEAASVEVPQFLSNTSGDEQLALTRTIRQQQEQILSNLRRQEPDGRLVIHVSPDIHAWENTAEDIEMRDGDELVIPKRPAFVLVSGQVYSPAAINYTPHKNAGWYLAKAGGATDLANRKDIFVIRADGSVVGQGSGSFWKRDVLSTRLQPGDTIVVPEKVLSGNSFWRSLFGAAQMMSAFAVSAKLVSGL